GRKQSEAAGKKLAEVHKKESFDLILHSPLLRTQQTAEIIRDQLLAAHSHLPPTSYQLQPEPLIREITFGSVEGKRDHEVKEYMEWRENLPPEERYHSKCGETGEAQQDVTKRAREFVQKMIREHAGKSILVVTHSDVIRLLLRELNGSSLELLYSKGHFPICEPKEIYLDNHTGKLV